MSRVHIYIQRNGLRPGIEVCQALFFHYLTSFMHNNNSDSLSGAVSLDSQTRRGSAIPTLIASTRSRARWRVMQGSKVDRLSCHHRMRRHLNAA